LSVARGALADRFLAALGPVDHPLGLAVSGGGDSVALLCLAVEAGLPVIAVTVDHGLRPEAAGEAAWVGALCARLGVAHDVLRWQDWDGTGNLQDAARRARLRLIADWARGHGIGMVALGHTQDDQAETVLMRLARRAGVDGLAGMAPWRHHLGVCWTRPLLGTSRAELRDWLRARGQAWKEDPSNDALRFDRVKARRALAALGPLGLDALVLSGVAAQMADARAALRLQTQEAARRMARVEGGDVVIGREGLGTLPHEIRRRLLLAAILWVSSAEYGPRSDALQRALDALEAGRDATLSGCRLLCRAGQVRITREAKALRATVAAPMDTWDGRWCVTGPEISGLEVRMLGEAGLALCPDWREKGRPRASHLAEPAVWKGEQLIAAPLSRNDPEWHAETIGGSDAFFLSILSH
jgi:tRNA(Ile)-lysidine synthase